MTKLPATRRGQLALVLIAAGTAIGGGVIAGRNLFAPSAAVRTVRAQTASEKYGVLQAQARAHPAKSVVPFLGPFAHGKKGIRQCGKDVRLMEGALLRTTPPVRTAKAQLCFGLATERQIKVFQKRHHIPPSGIYGPRTHQALSHTYSVTQRNDLVYLAGARVVIKERAAASIILGHAYLVGQNMAYSQSNRGYFPAWPAVQSSGDCSSFATWVMYQTGVGARVGYYGPGSTIGWTGSLRYQGQNVPLGAKLQIGDLLFYYGFGHVAVYAGHGLVEGHGTPGVHLNPFNFSHVDAVRRMIY